MVGDVVVTSGLGGSYAQAGCIVGTVVRVDAAAGRFAAGAYRWSPPNDTAASLAEVLVVRGRGSEGALGSEGLPEAGRRRPPARRPGRFAAGQGEDGAQGGGAS